MKSTACMHRPSELDPRWAGMLAQLHGQMSSARVAQHMPDAASTAQLISVAENLLLQVPSAAKVAEAEPASRAEAPPQGYWRRWSEDAPPADAGQDAAAQDATPGEPAPSTASASTPAAAPTTSPCPRWARAKNRRIAC